MSAAATSPWGLSPMQCDVLDQIVATGSITKSAAALGLSTSAIATHVRRARSKTGAASTIAIVLQWDRIKRPAETGAKQ